MKNPILALVALCLLFSACKKERSAKTMPADIGSYITAYTSGSIPRTAPIEVHFTAQIVDESAVGSQAEKSTIWFEPSIRGEATWVSNSILRFQPSEHLPSGVKYIGKVNLKALYSSIPEAAQTFEFDFQTREQYFEVNVEGLQADSPSNLKKQTLIGNLYTADYAESNLVEKLLSASYNGSKLDAAWQHSEDGKTHTFSVPNIPRGNKDGALNLAWNGAPLDLDIKGERKVEVPALGNFKLLDAQLAADNGAYLLLNFSDPLLESQDLTGLIRISGYDGALRTAIDGNFVRVYTPQPLTGKRTIKVSPGLLNSERAKMPNASEWDITFAESKPAVRLVGNGVIIPESNGLTFPFEAINLNAVDVEVFKIFQNNLLQFLQSNEISSSSKYDYELNRVGRIVLQKKVSLPALNPNAHIGEWTRYNLDLSQMVQNEKGAIYQIRLGFRQPYTDYACSGEQAKTEANLTNMSADLGENGDPISIMGDYYGHEGYYDGYEYNDREDPCKPAYYNIDRFVRRNVLASNLGLTAKRGKDGSMFVAVSDLRTTAPIAGVQLDLYDYQQQPLVSLKTDGDGFATFMPKHKAYFVVATNGTDKGYLRLDDGNSLSLSRYDVSGAETQKGLKGFLYGERGVWRPGDSLFLNFVLEDKDGKLPPNHPVTFELSDSKGRLQYSATKTENILNVYNFNTKTDPAAPTGNWLAKAKVGGAVFTKYLKVETVKPNRLKINVDFGKETLDASDGRAMSAKLNAKWLHGAPAKNLKAVVEAQINAVETKFDKFGDFVFDDRSRSVESEPMTLFDGPLDADGNATVNLKLGNNNTAPGKLRANLKTRVFEKGGDFSSDNFSVDINPYNVYAGVLLPKNKYGEKRLDIDKAGKLEFAAVNQNGKAWANRKLSATMYRVDWRWWWEVDENGQSHYNNASAIADAKTTELSTNSKGIADWNLTVNQWGRYFVRVCDEGGHCASDYFYAGYPWYDDDDNNTANRQAAAMLAFSSNKDQYNVGETVSLSIPVSDISKGLITIENGSKVLESHWFEAKKGDYTYTFKATSDMAPNIYAHVTLTQPHAQTVNDLPIRMYGVVPIKVEDPRTRLKPIIKMPKELQPEQKFTVEVSEANNNTMAYTLAIVDEGLLDLTRFKTPNPWDNFYAREALGVQTWDVYDHVLGAYGGQLERILSIGGDGEINNKSSAEKANRFKPVVKYLGPFLLKKGQHAKHAIEMPNYVGAVRAMVVASSDGAYGSAEQSVAVKKPLMVLSSLPRVLGPGESLKLPVNVFVMDKNIKNVQLKIEGNSFIGILGDSQKSLVFNGEGDQTPEFDITIADKIGIGKITVTATGGGHKASEEIEIDVRVPNPLVTDVYDEVLDKGKTWEQPVAPMGMSGTNTVTLEVSTIPPINLGERLNYLLQYPHGCIEQTTSSVFPQLYVNRLIQMDEKQKQSMQRNIEAGINRLKQFQTSTGGFGYWPGDASQSHWGTNYAGHFLLEAKSLGFNVPENVLDRFLNFQKTSANRWNPELDDANGYGSDELTQAYRLYTLALANRAELGAMNRLRERKKLDNEARWRLAAAYALAGKTEVAKEMTDKLSTNVPAYLDLGYTFGSDLRDKAMIAETMLTMKDRKGAASLIKEVSQQLGSSGWYNTQATGYALLAIGKFVANDKPAGKLEFAYLSNGQWVNAGSNSPMMQIALPTNKTFTVNVKNTSGGTLYARVINSGKPVTNTLPAAANKLGMTVAYTSMDGKAIDPASLAQGSDFVAVVTITNPATSGRYYREMALEQIFPSGWEIRNPRMDNINDTKAQSLPNYQDVRDDRVYTYFNIGPGNQQTYRIQLNAAYKGHYYLPTVQCSAMYDNSINARQPGKWVDVVGTAEASL